MAVSLGECLCSLRVRLSVGDLVFSDVCETSCMCLCVFACVCVCVCVCICVFGSVNINPTLIYPLILITTAFQPQSKMELQDAVKTCDIDPMRKSS